MIVPTYRVAATPRANAERGGVRADARTAAGPYSNDALGKH